MNDIALIISESIKTGKWIDIIYKNSDYKITYYWIAINDIDFKNKRLDVTIFNDKKSLNTLSVTISFERILKAKLLDFTEYEVNPKLIEKIKEYKDEASWLKYESFNNNILKYYMECNNLDNDPFQKSSFLIEGIDKDLLLKNKCIKLNNDQINKVLKYIYNYDVKKAKNHNYNLVISTFSIENDNKKYVFLYHDLFFNPINKTLSIDKDTRINQTFLINGKKHSISNYIDIDINEFINNITKNYDLYINEYREIIRNNLNNSEIINELPEFMILEREIPVQLEETYKIIEKEFLNGTLEYPLKAFFKEANRIGNRRKEPNIILYDQKVNIDQMRVIYNTMKYPITYVQGPPGTGKTQTILNVILSAFFNSKTVLICSSNNKPIDGIIEKFNFSYKDINIPFPYLRLGNRTEVEKALNRIKFLYESNIIGTPDDFKINRIKNKNIEENKILLNSLENYERRKKLEEQIEIANKLLNYLNNENSNMYINTKIQLSNLLKEYNNIPIITNEDVLKQVISVSNNIEFKQYLYYESLKYIQKLKLPRYKNLINICNINDEDEKVTEFNKWIHNDENLKLLLNVFPIIITTNISSSKLGTANNKFDLVIMDEAGQANIGTALLPISRSKSLLLVGDTNQLKPIIVLDPSINNELKYKYKISNDYDYAKYSILELMEKHDKVSKNIMLTYHYRCGKKIINFSNQRFYDNKLKLDDLVYDGNLSLIDIKNINSKYKNQNYEEANAVIEYIKRNSISDAAIITPFVNQQNLINNLLKINNINNITCGTIHSVQGAEKNTIIISPSISPKTSKKTFEWLKNNAEITNVAITRAKKNLILVSDVEAINLLSKDKKDDLYNLVNYIKNNGNIEMPANENKTIQIGLSNGSKNEDIFFETISHFCSVNKMFQAKRNVKLKDIFSFDPTFKNSNLEFDIVLYTIKDTTLIPTIAIELNGGEHFGDLNREKCDARKMKICEEKNIKILLIPNSFVKSYNYIKEQILSSCGQKVEQLELF